MTLESDIVEATDGDQAVKTRFNPWWLLGAVFVVVAVVLGVRSLRKPPAGDAMIPNPGDPA